MPNHSLADPYIVAAFINQNRIFVALFHNTSLTHYHFVFNVSDNKIEGKAVLFKIEGSSVENYPLKAFYNEDKDELYCFYR